MFTLLSDTQISTMQVFFLSNCAFTPSMKYILFKWGKCRTFNFSKRNSHPRQPVLSLSKFQYTGLHRHDQSQRAKSEDFDIFLTTDIHSLPHFSLPLENVQFLQGPLHLWAVGTRRIFAFTKLIQNKCTWDFNFYMQHQANSVFWSKMKFL